MSSFRGNDRVSSDSETAGIVADLPLESEVSLSDGLTVTVGEPDADYVIITASAGEHGTVSPSGKVAAALGGEQTFTFTPDTGWHVADVLTDGVSAGAVTDHTFFNVTAAHTVSAVFEPDTVQDTEPPSAPQNLTAEEISGPGVRLSWEPSSDNTGVEGYEVFRNGVFLGTVAETSFTDGDVAAGTLYAYTAEAYDAAGNRSGRSAPAYAAPGNTEPPAVPGGVTARGIPASEGSRIRVSWDPCSDNTGVTGYEVFRDGVSLGTVTETSFSDTDVSLLTPYAYTVKAYDGAGNRSGQSEPASVTLEDTEPPTVPREMTVTEIPDDDGFHFLVTWDPCSDNVGVTGYVIRNGETGDSTSETFYADSGVTALTTYTYTAEAYDAAGNRSGESDPITVTKTGDVPVPQVTFSASATSVSPGETVVLSWDTSGADSRTLGPGIGDISESGTAEVSPEETTTYTLTASGPGGTVTAAVTVAVPDRHTDLEVTDADVSDTETDPRTLAFAGTVQVVIANTGNLSPEAGCEVTVFEDSDHDGLFNVSQDNVIGSAHVPEVPGPGDSLTVPVPVSGTLLFADNLIFAFADSENDIPESDEENNISHSMADCEFTPPVGEFDPELEWSWKGSSDEEPDFKKVICVPIVINLNDDNGDGLTDKNDIPDQYRSARFLHTFVTN
ncbi:fibronectin type III domain-containing protein [Desulfonema magnum]|uniref:Fibronectin domain-containing protein n=1 Tax=Desulfonema magnum TaxID=45655 RepID=A0A975BWF8_9BACT|nr:hypothetical protein [Desulfonema magnum]QTA92989.1 fibronectin domain-containing protein [Desulfonema magnum]